MDLLRCALPAPDPELAASARRPFLADHVVQALTVGRKQPRAAGAAMATWFRRTRRLGSKDRRRVSELTFAVVRHEALLRRVADTDDAGLVETVARLLDGERFDELPSQGPAQDFATALSLPVEIAQEWLLPDAAQLGAVLSTRAPLFLRVNATWGPPEHAVERLATEGIETRVVGRWGLEVQGRANLQGTQAYRKGIVEIQDQSSQAFVEALGPIDGAQVLDLCAGAGGKSLAMAAAGASVHAWDVRQGPLDELHRRADRARTRVWIGPPEDGYDLVMVDAPCSGSGRLRREPALRWGIDPDRYLTVQAQLLADGAARVRPGGRLAYATCSLLARENDLPDPPDFVLDEAVMRWPHREGGDGFGWRIWTRATA